MQISLSAAGTADEVRAAVAQQIAAGIHDNANAADVLRSARDYVTLLVPDHAPGESVSLAGAISIALSVAVHPAPEPEPTPAAGPDSAS